MSLVAWQDRVFVGRRALHTSYVIKIITYSTGHIAIGSAIEVVTRPLELVVVADSAQCSIVEEKLCLSLNGDLGFGASL